MRGLLMPERSADMAYRPDIDGLRAVAVLAVVFYHAGLGFPGGYLGVDIFFVISGYLIIPIIYVPMVEGRFSAAEFFERRTRRLMPAMSAMLLGAALWSIGWSIAPDLRHFGDSLAAASVYVSNIYFYITNTAYFVESALTKPLLHTWSLGVEEQFYIAAPLGLWALVRFTPRRAHLPAILILSMLSFALSAWKWGQGSPAAFYLLPTRAWELGLGGALALAAPRLGQRRGIAETLSHCGLGAILAALLFSWESVASSVWQAGLPVAGTAAILASGAQSCALVHRLLALRPLVFVGLISYSLYLWHWPVIVGFHYGSAAPLTPASALWAIVVSIGLAAASWRWVEQPVRNRRWLASRRRLFGAAALASALGIAAGLGLAAAKGLPQRHPQLEWLLERSGLRVPRFDCFEETAERIKAGAPCVRGTPGVAPSFVLAGDSHAHSLSQGLFVSARRHGLAGTEFAVPGFIPIVGGQARYRGRPDPHVPLFAAYLRRHPELHTVIVTGFWSHAASGRSYRDPTRIHFDSEPDGSGAAPVAFRLGLEKLIDAFADRRFILLDDVPTGEALNPVQYARQIHSGRPATVPGLPRAEADAQRATYEPVLREIAASRPNVAYVPVLSGLCGPRICPLLDSRGRLIYLDGDHLSTHGSEPLAAALDSLFRHWPRSRAPPEKAATDIQPGKRRLPAL
jgi:peptidoglycan/LPS O-acetylase OafA/YrhL